MANEDAKDGQKSYDAFVQKHGTMTDLAKAVGSEEEFQVALKPIFDSVLGMVQIVTAGDPNQIKALVREPNLFFDKLLQDDNGLLRGFLMARAMHEVVSRPSRRDPLEWGKFMLEIMSVSKAQTVVIPERVEGEVVPGSPRGTAGVIAQLIPRVEKSGS